MKFGGAKDGVAPPLSKREEGGTLTYKNKIRSYGCSAKHYPYKVREQSTLGRARYEG